MRSEMTYEIYFNCSQRWLLFLGFSASVFDVREFFDCVEDRRKNRAATRIIARADHVPTTDTS